MNNYCTNCGKKLSKNNLICSNCNTPIIDLPYNYEYKSPKNKKIKIIILFIIGGFLIGYFSYNTTKTIIYKTKINKLQKKYVEPYLKGNYINKDYSIKYSSSGKCIISGNCKFDPVLGCDGGSCEEYTYLDNCDSYYYSVKIDNITLTITVFYKDNIYTVIEGKNIYGTNK